MVIDHTLGPRVKNAREAATATREDAIDLLRKSRRFIRIISPSTLARIEGGRYRRWEAKWTEQLKYLLGSFTVNNLTTRE